MTANQPQPGSDLDAAIAEALGWRLSIIAYEMLYGDKCYYWCGPRNEQQLSPPKYSTDTATAIATLEQLCKPVEEGGRGWAWKYESPNRKSFGTHDVTISDRFRGVVRSYCSKDSLARAIAEATLAMLAALEAEVKEECL